jgi:hypothetical protein
MVCASTQFGVPSTYSVFVGMTNLSLIGKVLSLFVKDYVVATTNTAHHRETSDSVDVVGDIPRVLTFVPQHAISECL